MTRTRWGSRLRRSLVRSVDGTGLSRAQLARGLDVSRQAVADALSEENDPRLSTVDRIAESAGLEAHLVLVPKDRTGCVLVLRGDEEP